MTSSKYNVIVEYKDKLLLYNSLTCSFSYLNNGSYSENLLNDFFKSPIAKEMGYTHDDFYNEEKAYLMKMQDKREIRFLNLVILPTMQCNFHCTYCYECKKSQEMQQETVKSIENFISRHLYEYSGLHIGWFGGEPLLKLEIIEAINKKAKNVSTKLGKPFFSSITTNGYLLTRDVFERLLKLNIKKYTVTLDGTKEYHDKYRKLHNNMGTYDTLINNMVKIREIDRNFSFDIRMNVNKENCVNLDSFIDKMYKWFGNDIRFDLSLVLTSNWGGETVYQMKDDLLKTTEILYEIAIKNKNKFKFNNLLKILEGESCQFANRHSYVIDTSGNLLKCTVHFNHEKINVGRILSTGNLQFDYSNLSYWNLHNNSFSECDNCKMSLSCKGRFCLALDNYKNCCGYTDDKLKKMIIAKYELDKSSFYCIDGN